MKKLLILLVFSHLAAVEITTPELVKAKAAFYTAQAAYMQAIVDAWCKADIPQITVPKLSKDPRASESEMIARITAANGAIDGMNQTLKPALATALKDKRYNEQFESCLRRAEKNITDAEKAGAVYPNKLKK